MFCCIPRNPDSRSNPGQSGAGSQHLIQPQNTYKRFKISVSWLFRGRRHYDTTPQIPRVGITAFGNEQTVPDGHEQHASVDIVNVIHRTPGTAHNDSFNPANVQAKVPVATQFESAQGVTISGHPIMTNIGMNTGVQNVTTVHNYSGSHGLENLKEFVSFAALHNSAAQDPDRRCHPGTRENVLMQLRQWIDNPNTTDRIFWLYGPAGAGKSAIAQTIAHGYHQGEVAATFFFFRSDARRNDGNRLFPTIAWQLAFSIPAIKDFIVHALDETPHLPMTAAETQFEQFVAQVFQVTNNIDMRHPAPVVIIDGVDECLDEQLQRRILVVIGNAVKNCRVPLRFLISSRPESLIEDTLNQFQDFTLRIDLAALDDSNRDVEKYLVDKFSVITSKQGLEASWPGQEIIEDFVFKSSGNFIFASTVMRYISDEDYSAVSQLDIVRNLKPRGMVSPFALLDELYLEVLKQPRDQDFLKTFLALFVGRSFSSRLDLHEDDAMLMNVSEQELHIKLRRMRALFKLEPFIDVYHKSFIDFLQDPSRSGQYHVSKQGGLRRYLKLIVNSVVRHVSMSIEEFKCHDTCRASPRFKSTISDYPSSIVLPAEDWQEALKPLLHLQDKLLKTSKPQPCRVTHIMRELLLHLAILQRISHHITAAPAPVSHMHEADTEQSPIPVTEAMPENDLDNCLSALLSYLKKHNSLLTINAAIFDRMSSLLTFDCAEIAARVRSVLDAQKLIDLIDLMNTNRSFQSQYSPDARCKAAYLASEIFARVPLLPTSFLNSPTHYSNWSWSWVTLELVTQSMMISKILDHNYIVPVLGIYDDKEDELKFVGGNGTGQGDSVDEWVKRSSPDFVTRIRVMLEVARTIRYIHSMDIALYSRFLDSKYFILDSNLHTKSPFFGLFSWWIREASIYAHENDDLLHNCSYESNIIAFGDLFSSVCFGDDDDSDGDESVSQQNLPPNHVNSLVGDARQLIERCRAKDPKSRPTIEDVVKEMETWNLT